MMDGIALRHAELDSGQREFPIQATQHAGDPQLVLDGGHCIEIMTGAALPDNADCIVPVERIAVDAGVATVEAGYTASVRQFIHPRGSDHTSGAHLLAPGRVIAPMDIAVIASCGLTEVAVSALPSISVISTGNELVAGGQPIEAQQIRMSNGPALVSLLQAHGYARSRHDHIPDDRAELARRIAEHLETSEVLVLSGGVSMGKADFVPQVMQDLGVELVFHKVSQRPGKPMWFGKGPDGQAVFALPGNPVSALVCCRHYVVPAIKRASGFRAAPPEFAVLAQDVQFKPQLTCFLPVNLLSSAAGQLLAMPVHTNTSGDFAALSGTAGYVELPLGESVFKTGRAVTLHRWMP